MKWLFFYFILGQSNWNRLFRSLHKRIAHKTPTKHNLRKIVQMEKKSEKHFVIYLIKATTFFHEWIDFCLMQIVLSFSCSANEKLLTKTTYTNSRTENDNKNNHFAFLFVLQLFCYCDRVIFLCTFCILANIETSTKKAHFGWVNFEERKTEPRHKYFTNIDSN